MSILITYEHPKDMRYVTVGDYHDTADGSEHYQVADMGDQYMNLLVALHELIESHLCRKRGISEPDIKAYDEAHADSDDPGSLPDCIYGKEHAFANRIEEMVMKELGVDPSEYEKALDKAFDEVSKSKEPQNA